MRMEDLKSSVNTLEEVKKLQELVRKLEIQNLHLRKKQSNQRKRSVSPVKEAKGSKNYRSIKNHCDDSVSEPNAENFEGCDNTDEYFDNLEIIRVSDIEMSDDESWLYTSPKSTKPDKLNENSYQWLRKDVDDPENKQLQLTKKSLLTKLNEIEMLSPSHKLTVHHAENPAISNLRRSQMMFKTPLSAQNRDPVDTRTFTRSKKKQALEFLEKLEFLNSEKSEKVSSSFQLHRRGSDVSSDSLSSCHILEDANDVQEVARMQEESLRMSSPSGTPKRSSGNSTSSRKVSSSSRGSMSDPDFSETSVFSSQKYDDTSSHEYGENDSFPTEALNHSDQSSPSESPYGSNASLHNVGNGKGKLGAYRRSLPNLNREPLTLRQSRNKVNDSNSDNLPLQAKVTPIARKYESNIQVIRKTRRELKSPSRHQQSNQVTFCQNTFQSPENTEPVTTVPKSADSANIRMQARSGLPRPARASSASRSVPKSGIPRVPTSMANKKRVEDSWSEGCF
ncbi:hypothetical protein JTE90_000021 [Oedothorax gibbosus]|uniref:SLAIN motif-containing protein 2 n=1 Tax=Oedothorax gibbosus TaxID=931172 RepID=A0AAV6TRV2_9ARAC|nr:hypothetical protein JTE90_000021 [Oedothorax gibbosus]